MFVAMRAVRGLTRNGGCEGTVALAQRSPTRHLASRPAGYTERDVARRKRGQPLPRESTSKSPAFVDRVSLVVRGGSGGQGSRKFGLPGGNGGDVVLLASRTSDLGVVARMDTLVTAGAGGHAERNREGSRGEDVVLPVPVGTVVTANGGCVHTHFPCKLLIVNTRLR